MFLYEKNGNKVDVYSFIPDEESLKKYRKENIEKLNIYDLFYCFETTSETIMNRFVNANELDTRFLQSKSDDLWSEIKKQYFYTSSSQNVRDELLEKYINGEFSGVLPTRTFISKGGVDCYLNNYLVTNQPTAPYSNKVGNYLYTLENIISLPKNLCTLQLLLNGRFSDILGTWLDYNEQIQYFETKKEAQVSSEELEKIINYGFLEEKYNGQINNKIETTSKILQKARQYGKVIK